MLIAKHIRNCVAHRFRPALLSCSLTATKTTFPNTNRLLRYQIRSAR